MSARKNASHFLSNIKQRRMRNDSLLLILIFYGKWLTSDIETPSYEGCHVRDVPFGQCLLFYYFWTTFT